jgi:hypothetical protein
METDNKTDPELIYWIPKYILMRNNKQFSQLGHMLQKMGALAESQDKIGWRNFTEGYISTPFYNIQRFHPLLSSNYLNRADGTRQFINKILQLTHRNGFTETSLSTANAKDTSAKNNQKPCSEKSQTYQISAPTIYTRKLQVFIRD